MTSLSHTQNDCNSIQRENGPSHIWSLSTQVGGQITAHAGDQSGPAQPKKKLIINKKLTKFYRLDSETITTKE